MSRARRRLRVPLDALYVTANFTKIVQRVPVRIRFVPHQPAVARLRPGLSVTARVRLAGFDASSPAL